MSFDRPDHRQGESFEAPDLSEVSARTHDEPICGYHGRVSKDDALRGTGSHLHGVLAQHRRAESVDLCEQHRDQRSGVDLVISWDEDT
jgi:hypothetical protein